MADKRIDSQSIDIINSIEKIDHSKQASGGIEIDTERLSSKEIDMEAFMRQDVEVYVNDAPTENDPGFVEINVNGDYRCIVRGDTVRLKRYHVAVLAQAKVSRLRQRKITHPDGSQGYIEENVTSLAYPFSVTDDPSPKLGHAWLKQQLANPG